MNNVSNQGYTAELSHIEEEKASQAKASNPESDAHNVPATKDASTVCFREREQSECPLVIVVDKFDSTCWVWFTYPIYKV